MEILPIYGIALQLTIMVFIGKPGVLRVLVCVIRVSLRALLGTKIFIRTPALLGITDLVLICGTWAMPPSISWAGK